MAGCAAMLSPICAEEEPVSANEHPIAIANICGSFNAPHLMNQIRYESLRLGFESIDGRGGRDVERVIVLVSPVQICGLFGHDDRAEMIALRVPDPDAFGTRDK